MEEPVGTDVLSSIADRIEEVVRTVLSRENAGCEVGVGADGTPMTLVDREADREVLQAVEDMNLHINVLSEESGFTDNGADWTLIVDPLDGTYNALRGSGPYAISLAVGRGSLSGVVAGLVRDLRTGKDYHAVKARGSYFDGQPIHVSSFSPEDSVFSVYFGSMSTGRCRSLAEIASKVRYMGCVALEMCLVAAGSLDACFVESVHAEHNPRISDVAAAWLVLSEAGGFVLDADQRTFDMKLEATARCSMLAVGDRRILEVMP